MFVLDMGFHVVIPVVFSVTEFTLEKLFMVVHKSNVSFQFHLVCELLSTLTTFNFDPCFLLLRHFAKPLMTFDAGDRKV